MTGWVLWCPKVSLCRLGQQALLIGHNSRTNLAPARMRWRSRGFYLQPRMKNGVYYIALGIGLLTETALGQTPSPTIVAQSPTTLRPSGVLTAPPPAPVAVPPSGVLPTIERRAVTTLPFKTAQKIQTAKRAKPVAMHRHVVRSAAGRKSTTRTATGDQSIAVTPPVVSKAAEQSRHDGIGYEFFVSQLGKAKEAK